MTDAPQTTAAIEQGPLHTAIRAVISAAQRKPVENVTRNEIIALWSAACRVGRNHD